LQWQRVAQGYALLQDRWFVIPEDIQGVAVPVLSVRMTGISASAEQGVASVISQVAVPKL
jgi:MoxR-like ATPase